MFIRVSTAVGFNSDAVAYWDYVLTQPPAPPSQAEAPAPDPPPAVPFDPDAPPEEPTPTAPPTDSAGLVAIGSLDPPLAALGWGAFTLHVYGRGFLAGSVLVWNGGDETTTVVNGAELTTAVDMATAQVAMEIPVYVRTPDGTMSNVLHFHLLPAQTTPAAIGMLTLHFGMGSELELVGAEADRVREYYSVPSSQLTVL
jgi:hypothetical protein